MVGAALLVLALYSITTDLLIKAVLLPLTLAAFTLIAWHFILEPQERHLFKSKLGILSLLSG